jgi:hypothetical protein
MHHLYRPYPLKTGMYDIRGVWPVGKLCEFAGTFLARRKRWALLIATGFGAIDMGVNLSAGASAQGWQTLLAMGGIFGLYLAGAYGLKYGPMLLQGRKRGTAESANLNLMEDYRKNRADVYLAAMWNDVFQYEPFADYADLYPRKTDEAGHVLEAATGLEKLAAASDGDARRRVFLELAHQLLTTAQPQSEQERQLGTGFEMLEDHFDAGPWTVSDRKLEQNYDSHPRLQEAKKLAGYGWSDMGHEMVKRFGGDLWFRFLRSSLAAQVGEALVALNERFDNTINAQRLLWPGNETTPLPGLDQAASQQGQASIRACQQRVMRSRVGADFARARRKLGRGLTPIVELATTLRARFDAEYVAGEIGDIVADLKDEDRDDTEPASEDRSVRRASQRQREAAERLSAFDTWLAKVDLAIATWEQRRAARIAFHVNYQGMQDAFYAAMETQQDLMAAKGFHQPLCEVLGRPHPWTYMLIDVRMLHVLARVRRAEYQDNVWRLGGYAEASNNSEAAS